MKGVKTIRQAGRWLCSRWQSRGLILLYHRVAEAVVDPFGICVAPAHFEAQMAALSTFTTPVRLAELVADASRGSLPDRAVAVTFDDGYADNLAVAVPILERYQIPATVFVVAGRMGEQFWWDVVAWAILTPARLPSGTLRLTIGDHIQEWRPSDSPNSRRQLLGELHRMLRPLSAPIRNKIMADLLLWVGIGPVNGVARSLTEREVIDLERSQMISIGAHTMTHPPLAQLTTFQQKEEIEQSKAKLESLLSKPVTLFSYPYGLPADYSVETTYLVQQAGFHCACTNIKDVVRTQSNSFQLPRFWVSDWGANQFRRYLEFWL
jgi:peptidoglycan/xylan/chitin deacetylase (PgdA/CDA1 family)